MLFSGLRENPDFAFDDLFYEEILEKKQEFEALSPEDQEQQSEYNSEMLNKNLSFDEVSKAIDKAKLKKAYLDIPMNRSKMQMLKFYSTNSFNFVLFRD